MLNPVAIIEKKKAGTKLTGEEIRWMLQNYVTGAVRDYQMSALLMAVYFQGMDSEETADMTAAMLESGKVLDFGPGGSPRVDKHSTGGVGDKVSIALAPLAASLGIKVPMLSGRSLGHTGGTLDKLESIPHFRSVLSLVEMKRMIESVGCFISGQTNEIAPADKKLYALRDVTGTVDSIPLITSSILSKKLSEGIEALVMDVKFGSGAFMRSKASARKLARSLLKTGEEMGLRVSTVLTSVEQPLGFAVGNALEVIEAVNLLRGKGPRDLMAVTGLLAAEMIVAADLAKSKSKALQMARRAVASGAALKHFKKWVAAQGGTLRFERADLGLELAGLRIEMKAWRSGFVRRCDAKALGLAVMDLGGGRVSVDDDVDHSVGLILRKKINHKVKVGEPLAVFYARDMHTLREAEERARSAFHIGNSPVGQRTSLIIDFPR
jgi:pyrimidine-nucleoside phosphorylase